MQIRVKKYRPTKRVPKSQKLRHRIEAKNAHNQLHPQVNQWQR